jgi:phosphoribosylaminoimidazole (AIR) synthetase
MVTVKIFADLDPMDRYERYHLPLDAELAAHGLGEVTGGGTLEDIESGRVLYSDLHIRIDGDVDSALSLIRVTLTRCGVPPAELCVEGTSFAMGLALH